jgi:hypothetical protein
LTVKLQVALFELKSLKERRLQFVCNVPRA